MSMSMDTFLFIVIMTTFILYICTINRNYIITPVPNTIVIKHMNMVDLMCSTNYNSFNNICKTIYYQIGLGGIIEDEYTYNIYTNESVKDLPDNKLVNIFTDVVLNIDYYCIFSIEKKLTGDQLDKINSNTIIIVSANYLQMYDSNDLKNKRIFIIN